MVGRPSLHGSSKADPPKSFSTRRSTIKLLSLEGIVDSCNAKKRRETQSIAWSRLSARGRRSATSFSTSKHFERLWRRLHNTAANSTSRRDGDPFLNLLLIAPLYDDKGIIRYFLGAQVDINGLVEDGRCLESFSILLQQDRCMSHINGKLSLTPKAALAELSGYLNEQERNAIQNHGERLRGTSDSGSSRKQSGMRRMIGMQDIDNNGLWPAPRLGPNGRLPGVFQNVRSAPPPPWLNMSCRLTHL